MGKHLCAHPCSRIAICLIILLSLSAVLFFHENMKFPRSVHRFLVNVESQIVFDKNFHFDGTSSDLAQQFYSRYLSGAKIDQLPLSNMQVPDEMQQRLSLFGISFSQLNGYLQRALLWDSGYVFSPNNELRKIHTAGAAKMSDIAISFASFNHHNCSTFSCSVKDSDNLMKTTYRSDRCRGKNILEDSICATEDVEDTGARYAIWATGGSEAADPEPIIVRQAWHDDHDDRSFLVFAIHTMPLSMEPTEKSCPKEGNFGSIIIPCLPYTSFLKSTFSSPAHGELVTTWLRHSAKLYHSQYRSNFIIVSTMSCLVIFIVILLSLLYRKTKRKRLLKEQLLAPDTESGRKSTMTNHYFLDTGSMKIDGRHDAAYLQLNCAPIQFLSSEKDSQSLDLEARVDRVMNKLLNDPMLQGHHLSMENLTFNRLIASKANTEVWDAQYLGKNVAVNRLIPHRNRTFTHIEEFVSEIVLAASLRHPNIVAFVGVTWSSLQQICLVLEYGAKGDLSTYLKRSGDLLRWPEEKRDIALGIAKGLTYLHSLEPSIVHCNLMTKHVLLTERLIVKLVHIGAQRQSIGKQAISAQSIRYTAPEILRGEACTTSSDIYAFGVLLFEIDMDQSLYRSQETPSFDNVSQATLTFSANCPLDVYNLAQNCLMKDSSARPSASELVQKLQKASFVPRK